jgi:septal ring factor EnvC (AmiA/AmiB activator)
MVRRYQRDVLVFVAGSAFTALVFLVSFAWAIQGERQRVERELEDAQAEQQRSEQNLEAAQDELKRLEKELEGKRDLGQRNLLEQAAQLLRDFEGNGDKAESEVLKVSTNAVAPEIPEGAYVLIDKKTSSTPLATSWFIA